MTSHRALRTLRALSFVLPGALLGCTSERSAPNADAAPAVYVPNAEDLTKAGDTVDRFHAMAAAANEEAYFALFDPSGVFLGTDGKERWTVPQFRAYAHPRFATGKAWSFRSTHRDLAAHGEVVWFDESLDTPNLGPARGSGVLVRDGAGNWKVAQYNLSIPIPNERFAAVKRVIEGADPAPAPSPSGSGSSSPKRNFDDPGY